MDCDSGVMAYRVREPGIRAWLFVIQGDALLAVRRVARF